MRREEVFEEFGIPISEWGNCEVMADEIIVLRDTAWAERLVIEQLHQRVAVVQAERESVSSQLWDCMNERDALKERLAAIEIGRSIETFTAAEHVAALVAMGAQRIIASQAFYNEEVLWLPPEMRDA